MPKECPKPNAKERAPAQALVSRSLAFGNSLGIGHLSFEILRSRFILALPPLLHSLPPPLCSSSPPRTRAATARRRSSSQTPRRATDKQSSRRPLALRTA